MLNSFKTGHHTDLKNGTGCTVILPPEKNVTSASARGAATGSREYALLMPDKKIQAVQALLLTGGSAFGLNAAAGVVRYLEEQGRGYKTPHGVVPIVAGAVIYDLNIGNARMRPGEAEGYTAAKEAIFNNRLQGNVGAGSGATVGKWAGLQRAMKGGLGWAHSRHGGIEVSCCMVVNAVGDVLDATNNILAGAHDGQEFLGQDKSRYAQALDLPFGNTVIGAILCNARLSKQEAHYLADRAHFALARRIRPSHTSYDGDLLFLSSDCSAEETHSLDLLSIVINETVEQAMENAVLQARELHGVPAANR